jgi:hypothetical protein
MNISQIFQQEPTIELTSKDDTWELYRLKDEEYYHLSQNSLPIKNSAFTVLSAERYFQYKNKNLTLPKLYILLTNIAGESSKFYDDWKGSFCFPFLMKIKKKEGELNNYLFIISDWRGNLEFRFKRLIGENEDYPEGIERAIIREPFENEFSKEEIEYFTNYFYGFLVGYFSTIEKRHHQNFFKHIDSNLILYGYTDGKYWEKYYEEYDYYHQRLDELKLEYQN